LVKTITIKTNKMQSAPNHVVVLSYQLRTEPDGPIADEATAEAPFGFLMGHGNVLPKFEEALSGLTAGEGFSFTLTPEEGYGITDPNALVALDINMFANEDGTIAQDLIFVGNAIPLSDNQGNRYRAVITHFDNENVHVDLNHPMAGKTLHFSGTVIEVRPATEQELEHGHVHMGGHDH
jgi:FKBP-type peptidyl-prolyl cis-trans isomerase SlyD